MMRISILTDTFPPDINGVAMTVARLADGLTKLGHGVEVIRPNPHGLSSSEPEACLPTVPYEIVNVRSLPLPLYSGLRFGLPQKRRLAARWEINRPDVVYIATEGILGNSALRIARELGLPVATGFHTHFGQYLRHYRLPFLQSSARHYLKKFHNQTSCTLVPTRQLVVELRERGFHNVHRLGRGVDTEHFNPSMRKNWLREQWGVDPGDPVALYVGRIAPEKNLPLALAAFRKLKRVRPNLKMVVVGDGPASSNKLRRQFPDVIWSGAKQGEVLATFYASADLFLFPSETETYGNVVLEALASGLVTVAFDNAAAAELITDGENGFLVPRGDHAAFHTVIGRALAMTDEWPKIRQRARQTASKYSWPAITHTFATYLSRIARHPLPPIALTNQNQHSEPHVSLLTRP